MLNNLDGCDKGQLYHNLKPDEISHVLSSLISKEYKKGLTVSSSENAPAKIFILKKGMIEISQLSKEGKKVIIEIVRPGGIFANTSFSFEEDEEYSDFVEATLPSIVCEISKDDFKKLVSKIPQLAINYINIIGLKLTMSDVRIRDLALLDIKSRLKHELTHMARTVGFDKGEYYVIRGKVTHEDLASIIGASRETVTKALHKLKDEGFIDHDKLNRLIVRIKKM